MDKLIGDIYLLNGTWVQALKLDMTEYFGSDKMYYLTAPSKAELKILISKVMYEL